jgi:hypothetical protein
MSDFRCDGSMQTMQAQAFAQPLDKMRAGDQIGARRRDLKLGCQERNANHQELSRIHNQQQLTQLYGAKS